MGRTSRVERMMAPLEHSYYWPNIEDDMRLYIKTCLVYQLDKTEKRKSARLLQPLPNLEKPWQSVSTDFILGMAKAKVWLAIWLDPVFCPIDLNLIFRVLTRIFRSRVGVGLKYLGPNKFQVRVGLNVGDKVLLKLTPHIWKKISSKTVHRGLVLK